MQSSPGHFHDRIDFDRSLRPSSGRWHQIIVDIGRYVVRFDACISTGYWYPSVFKRISSAEAIGRLRTDCGAAGAAHLADRLSSAAPSPMQPRMFASLQISISSDFCGRKMINYGTTEICSIWSSGYRVIYRQEWTIVYQRFLGLYSQPMSIFSDEVLYAVLTSSSQGSFPTSSLHLGPIQFHPQRRREEQDAPYLPRRDGVVFAALRHSICVSFGPSSSCANP